MKVRRIRHRKLRGLCRGVPGHRRLDKMEKWLGVDADSEEAQKAIAARDASDARLKQRSQASAPDSGGGDSGGGDSGGGGVSVDVDVDVDVDLQLASRTKRKKTAPKKTTRKRRE